MRRLHYGKAVLAFMFPVIVLVCVMMFYQNTEAESKGDKADTIVSYESVLICKGDTLWSIAKANLDNPTDTEIHKYVKEIASLNNISENGGIHTGNYVLIPKYGQAS